MEVSSAVWGISKWKAGTGFQIGSGGRARVGRAVWEAITRSIYCKHRVGQVTAPTETSGGVPKVPWLLA